MTYSHEFSNPVVPGFAPDPSVILADGRYYLVTSSFHCFPGLPIFTSLDLKQWTLIGHAYNRLDQWSLEYATSLVLPSERAPKTIATGGLSAPTIRYHKGTFYIIGTNQVLHSLYDWRLENFIISTKDIHAGKWSDPAYIRFDKSEDSSFFDPDLFFDEDGRVYVTGAWRINNTKQPTCTIKQFEIDIASGQCLTDPVEVWGGHAKVDTEGPHIYKLGEWYYLLVAEGGTFEDHHLSIARSKSVSGPYESYDGNPILTARGTDDYFQNLGHGELVQEISGAWRAVVLGVRNEKGWPLGRESFLTSVTWSAGGWPMIEKPKPILEAGTEPFDNESLGKCTGQGEKPANALGSLEAVYIRNAKLSNYTFDKKTIKLTPSVQQLSCPSGTTTFVGLRQRSFSSTFAATLDLNAELLGKNSIEAGLALYKDHLRYASISYNFLESRITFRVTNTAEDVLRSVQLPMQARSSSITFRIHASPQSYTLSLRTSAGTTWTDVGTCDVETLFGKDFIGSLFGIFAHCDNENEAIAVTFSDIESSTLQEGVGTTVGS